MEMVTWQQADGRKTHGKDFTKVPLSPEKHGALWEDAAKGRSQLVETVSLFVIMILEVKGMPMPVKTKLRY